MQACERTHSVAKRANDARRTLLLLAAASPEQSPEQSPELCQIFMTPNRYKL